MPPATVSATLCLLRQKYLTQ